jgi:aspartate aminotransferase
MKIAKRLTDISASPTMAVMEEAKRLKKKGIDVIDFGPGEPDFPTPDVVKQAGIDAIEADFTRYTSSSGILELREAVASRYNGRWGTSFTAKNVVISSGAKHSIYNVCMAVFQDNHEVLIPSPYWVTFPEVVKLAHATPMILETDSEEGFVVNPEDVEGAVSPKTRGLVVNSPNNPTGAVIPREAMQELMRFCGEKRILLLSDETYEDFVYDGREHTSAAAFVGESDLYYAIVGSMSKTFSMTGWRIGYCLGHERLISKISEFQSHQSGNPASMSQKAALVALDGLEETVEEMRKEYGARRRLVLSGLEEIPGFNCPTPYGAFYAFPDVTEALKATGIPNSVEFSKFLIQKARVATVPGSAFGCENFIRISYATSRGLLREGLKRMRAAVEEASGI